MAIFETIIIILIGLCLGSFATAITHRELNDQSWFALPKKQKGKTHRSACPSCDTTLTALDLVPVLSWLALRGKCRHCKAPISRIYPVTEITSVLLCLGLYTVYGFAPLTFLMLLSVPFLISMTIIDLRQMLLPNRLLLSLGAIGALKILLLLFSGGGDVYIITNALLGFVLFGGVSWAVKYCAELILKKPALGQGDVKLFAVCGLWLGAFALADFYILSGILGLILGIMWKYTTKSKIFPFGPAIIACLYIMMLTSGSFLTVFIIQ